MRRLPATVPVLLLVVTLSGCVDPMYTARPAYDTDIRAEDFVAGVDHPFLPLVTGASWTYLLGGDSMDDLEEGRFEERIEVEVLAGTRPIEGMQATVVRDTVYDADGHVIEDTQDWFGQDRDGNVWYLGEDSCEFKDDVCEDRAGSWEWGKDGALPGIVMHADPRPAEPYYQEYFPGEAVDRARVVGRGETVETPFGTYTDTVTTEEWNPLERRPGVETAQYVRGIGLVLKGEKGGGPGDLETLIAYDVPGFGSGEA